MISKTTATMYPTINQDDVLDLLIKVPTLKDQEIVSDSIMTSLQNISNSEKEIITNILKVDNLQKV